MDKLKLPAYDTYGKPFEIKAVGQILKARGQYYLCSAVREVRRKDGSLTEIAVLDSRCCECSAPFTFTVAMRGEKFQPNRRCKKHHSPGRAAGKKTRRSREVVALTSKLERAEKKLADTEAKLHAAEQALKEKAKEAAAASARADKAERRLATYELTPAQEKRLTQHQKKLYAERRAARRSRVRRAKAILSEHDAMSVFG